MRASSRLIPGSIRPELKGSASQCLPVCGAATEVDDGHCTLTLHITGEGGQL